MLTERTASRAFRPGLFNRLAAVTDAQRQQWGVTQTTQGVHTPLPTLKPTESLSIVNDHPWRFAQDDDTSGVITLGAVYMGGVAKTVTDFPTDGKVSSITATTIYYIEIDFANATATWKSTTGAVPASSATVENWIVLTITCEDSIISEIMQNWPSDIRALLNP